MKTSTVLAPTKVVTRDGVVTATLLDRVSVDRIALMLVRGAFSARYATSPDGTGLVPGDARELVLNPRSDD